MGVRVSSDARFAVVSNGRHGSISVIDVASGAVARTIGHVGARPWGLDMARDGRTVVVANGPSGDVAVVDAIEGSVTSRFAAGSSPWGVAILESR
jgi:YVTN family beta-propeller protein